LVISLKTAKALGLTIPHTLLLQITQCGLSCTQSVGTFSRPRFCSRGWWRAVVRL
jgi:hypothetical protein